TQKFHAVGKTVRNRLYLENSLNEAILSLKNLGVGVEYACIDVLELEGSIPRQIEDEPEQKMQRETSLIVEKIYEDVNESASMTFDFITFVILSAIMAGSGLAQNNITVIVASMVLAPLMGPMLGVALGYVVGDKALFIRGTRNELIALVVSFGIGILMGSVMLYLMPELVTRVESNWMDGTVTEITRRGGFSWIDVSIAAVSGAAVAISVTRGEMSSLVGVAISAALMPPAVNVGMMLALGLFGTSTAALQIGLGGYSFWA
ncbi:MAG: TIGR00341 family protein, partial [Promethearchaeia archaeon]